VKGLLGTNINFGTQEVDTKAIQDVLVAAAGAEIVGKAVESYTSAVDIAADYTFEKLADSLEAIVDRLQNEQQEARKAAHSSDSSSSASTATEEDDGKKKKGKDKEKEKEKLKKPDAVKATPSSEALGVPPKKPSQPPPEPPSKKGIMIKLGGPPSPIGRLFGSKKREDEEGTTTDDLKEADKPIVPDKVTKSTSSGKLPVSAKKDKEKEKPKDKAKAKKAGPIVSDMPPAPAGALDEMEKKTAGPLADPRANRARLAQRRRPPTRRPREDDD